MSLQQRLAVQQQEYQHQQRQQQQPQAKRSTGQHMHANGHLSKPELHQLQIMEQMHQQQHHPTAAQQQVQQYQQQFQTTQPQQLQPQLSQQVVAAVENSSTSKKGKQRETAVAPPAESSTKPKKSNSRARAGPTGVGVVDPVLAAQIKDSLNTPLLPTGKKRVELVSTESEFETTDDEGDDDDEGEWSSAEMTVDDEEVRQTQEEQEQNRLLLLQIQQQHDHQMQLLQQQQREQRQQQATRPRAPQAPQRTHSSHYPAPNNARGQQLTRAQMQRQAQAQQALVDKAVIEAQRQREMFVKLPTSSFQDLAKARTNSVGLLTQLMNPDVEQFPPNHPYRRGFSSGELRRSGISALSSMQPMTPVVAPTPTPAVNADQPPAVSAVNAPKPMLSTTSAPAPSDAPAAVVKAASSTSRPVATRRNTADIVPTRTAFSPPLRSGGLVLTKSSVALPTATQLQVGSVATKLAHRTSALLERVNINGSGGSGGYRPKGPPKDQEMEEDSDSDDGAIQISKSIAQEKLKALAERRGIKPTAKALDPNAPGPSKPKAAGTDDNDVPQWVVAQPQAQHQRSQSQGEPVQRRVPTGLQLTRVEDEDAPLPPATAPSKSTTLIPFLFQSLLRRRGQLDAICSLLS
ncbi:hypothetical protein BJ912DRAFT_610643 [Pholiota molesta]|nr:hypothetical protein BJ912DRAFT_610643 [Pholiota molesta]